VPRFDLQFYSTPPSTPKSYPAPGATTFIDALTIELAVETAKTTADAETIKAYLFTVKRHDGKEQEQWQRIDGKWVKEDVTY
jgi:hypothetical protein